MDREPHSLPESNTSPATTETVSEKIGRILGYTPTNPDFVGFINTYGHTGQLDCLERQDGIQPKTRAKLVRKIRRWERECTDSVARAAMVIIRQERKNAPQSRGVNIPRTLKKARELIKKEVEGSTSAFEEIGYRGRR